MEIKTIVYGLIVVFVLVVTLFAYNSASKNPNYDFVYDLYFRLSKNRIFKIPVSIKPKSLYVITIFKIRRKIQDEAIKYYKK